MKVQMNPQESWSMKLVEVIIIVIGACIFMFIDICMTAGFNSLTMDIFLFNQVPLVVGFILFFVIKDRWKNKNKEDL